MPISAAFSICALLPPSAAARPGRRHRAGDADFALASDLGAGQRGVALAQAADRRSREQERDDAVLVGVLVEFPVVADHGGNDARGAVGRRGHDARRRRRFPR